jgi:hypothetical protein
MGLIDGIGKALTGAGQAGAAVAFEEFRNQALDARQATLLEAHKGAQKDALEGRIAGEKELIDYRGRGQRAIADAVKAASGATTGQTPDVDYPVTRTPTSRELYGVAEKAALEQGDATAAKAYHDLSKPVLTKVGQDDTILDESGRPVFQNQAGANRRVLERDQKHQDRLDELRIEYQLKAGLERFKQKNGEGAATALMKNVTFLVDNGVAKDETDAFNKLRTTTEKSESEAITGLMGRLMQNPSYRGRGGASRAREDATAMVREIRNPGSSDAGDPPASAPPRPSSFLSAEDVRAAYKAGKIDRPSAVRELGRFGYDQ